MASSRLEKIGTIFSRVTGLLRAGAMKDQDTPLWYNIYKAFPPKYEPSFDRPAPNTPIRNILYPEDEIRARFHGKMGRSLRAVDMRAHGQQTGTQRFIAIHDKLREEGGVPPERLFEESLEVFHSQSPVPKTRSRVSTLGQQEKLQAPDKQPLDITDIFK